MPPWMARVPPLDWPALVCFLRMLTPSTTILCSRGSVRSTRPRLPRSLPAITTTVSPGARSRRLGMAWFLLVSIGLQHLRCERHDLHEVAFAQLLGDWFE